MCFHTWNMFTTTTTIVASRKGGRWLHIYQVGTWQLRRVKKKKLGWTTVAIPTQGGNGSIDGSCREVRPEYMQQQHRIVPTVKYRYNQKYASFPRWVWVRDLT